MPAISIKKILSHLNQKRKEKFPTNFVRRSRYDNLEKKYSSLVNNVSAFHKPLSSLAHIEQLKPIQSDGPELCIFVSYASEPSIKPHVAAHIKALLEEKIEVVLVINTDTMESGKLIQEEWMNQLSGLFIRKNAGFDFAAWSHIFKLSKNQVSCKRLYLINDSITSPLTKEHFHQMLTTIRSSSSDLIGLTENLKPRYHLQSFFLAINEKLLKSDFFIQYFSNILNLPSKEMVIDIYETNFTEVIKNEGYTVSAVFPSNNKTFEKTDNVLHQAEDLFKSGFPYLKISILKTRQANHLLKQYLPDLKF